MAAILKNAGSMAAILRSRRAGRPASGAASAASSVKRLAFSGLVMASSTGAAGAEEGAGEER